MFNPTENRGESGSLNGSVLKTEKANRSATRRDKTTGEGKKQTTFWINNNSVKEELEIQIIFSFLHFLASLIFLLRQKLTAAGVAPITKDTKFSIFPDTPDFPCIPIPQSICDSTH